MGIVVLFNKQVGDRVLIDLGRRGWQNGKIIFV